MWLNVYARQDGALVVVPALYQVPAALGRTGPLRRVGSADLDLALMPDAFVEAMGASGYAEVRGEQESLLRDAFPQQPATA
jgi:hypothetical protein